MKLLEAGDKDSTYFITAGVSGNVNRGLPRVKADWLLRLVLPWPDNVVEAWLASSDFGAAIAFECDWWRKWREAPRDAVVLGKTRGLVIATFSTDLDNALFGSKALLTSDLVTLTGLETLWEMAALAVLWIEGNILLPSTLSPFKRRRLTAAGCSDTSSFLQCTQYNQTQVCSTHHKGIESKYDFGWRVQ